MWGEVLLGLLNAAASSAENDANNEAQLAMEQERKKANEIQSQYQLAIEQEKTRQKKEETKRDIINGIIGGVFDVLSSASNTDSDTKRN